MLLLVLITYGIYIPVWFLNRKDTFNDLDSREKLSGGPIIFLLIIFIISAVMLIPSILFMETELGIMIDALDRIITLVGGIIILVLSFKVRRILSEHYKTNLLGVATFFFTLFYLQYTINRFLENKKVNSPIW
ncbi:DUF4234 domain-containing protein [candidate division WOR-3 bacterium]|nr:DUF4234 domain-containing protein [candidate division WOR-3 bacterium]